LPMLRNFDWLSRGSSGVRGVRFWLQLAVGVLAFLNAVALFFYFDPPGGSRKKLFQQDLQVQNEIAGTRGKALRLSSVSAKVQLGSAESADFESKYFLPKRIAYATVIAEIQRMAKASGLQERDAVFSEEPIEGSSDLSLLSSTANYEGTYASLMRFLHEVDHSPMLLILENLQAAPQQANGKIATSIRFQTIMQEEPTARALGGQP
jgi:Tfp pilus assembly protein PilO